MKKIFVAALALSSFSFPSFVLAKDACVPTMTVEQARAQLDAGYAKITQEANEAYTQAEATYDQANAASLAAHTARLQENEVRYQNEMAEIKADLQLGWREKLAAAKAAYNQALQQSADQYTAETQAHVAAYSQSVAQAQNAFTAKGTELNAQYSAAVCTH
jgi:phosphoenolpyruvate-protein kinase (PTS system EI component)